MSSALHQHLFLVASAVWIAASVVVSVSYRWLRPRLGLLEPEQRFRVTLFICASPLLVGVVIATATLLPSVGGLLLTELDHCSDHHLGHDHLCFTHTPESLGLEVWLLLAGLVAGIGPFAISQGIALLRASRNANALVARSSVEKGLNVIDSGAPFAITVGIFAPRVVVSRGLIDHLPPEHLKVVLAHEQAHVHRRDSLWKVLASILSLVFFPATRRVLLADLVLAAEQACDKDAADQIGNRIQVAQAILFMERLLNGFTASYRTVTTAFDNAPAVRRVELLLAETKTSAPVRLDIFIVLFVALALRFASSLHHAAETLLGLLGR
jgi:hypothetical protein